MKAYVIASGSIFALLVAAHIIRIVIEGPRVLSDAWFVSFTVLPAALCVWAWRVLRLLPRS